MASPFSVQFWVDKGYSEEEAKYEIAIRRPSNKLYWIHKGYSEEEAKKKLYEQSTKGTNRDFYIQKYGKIEGIKKYNERVEKFKTSSCRRKEFWMNKGYSEEEAIKKISELQDTRSYKNNIEKFGIVEGTKRVQKINSIWQATLNKKSPEELAVINKKKARTIENYCSELGTKPGAAKYIYDRSQDNLTVYSKFAIEIINKCNNIDELVLMFKNSTSTSFIKRTIKLVALQYVFKYGMYSTDITVDDVLCKIYNIIEIKKQIPSLYGNRYLFDGNVLLSDSELEIAKYLVENGINYEYGKFYPFNENKKYRYDFLIPSKGLYIEYTGIMDRETYKNRIKRKVELCLKYNLRLIASNDVSRIILEINK